MQRLEVLLLESAIADIGEISAFIARLAGYRSAGRRFLERLRGKCSKIGDTPGIGNARDDLGPGLRMTGFERRASIVFKVEAERVLIVNIFYGGRDVDGFYRRPRSDPDKT